MNECWIKSIPGVEVFKVRSFVSIFKKNVLHVGIKGYAVAETPTVVARTLSYIDRP